MDNPLKNFFGSLSTFLSKGDKDTAVGIDIGSSSIKVVEIKKEEEKLCLKLMVLYHLGLMLILK